MRVEKEKKHEIRFFGPGFKNLDNALRSYLRESKQYSLHIRGTPHPDYALAKNPRTKKWHIVIYY